MLILHRVFAFARDKGLPFPKVVGRMDPKWNIPFNAVYITSIGVVLLSLINLGSTLAVREYQKSDTHAMMLIRETVQHHRQPLPPRPAKHLPHQHRLRASETHQRRASPSGTLESRSLRSCCERFCILVLRIHHRFQLLPNEPSRGPQHCKLGSTGVGGSDDHVGDLLSCVWEETLYCTGRIC